jgi:glycerol uptake facilitator-like aquaporin
MPRSWPNSAPLLWGRRRQVRRLGSPLLRSVSRWTLILLVAIPVTNASVNPARSTGPAIFAGKAYIEQLWFFWAAPIAGAVLAGLVGRGLFRKP